MSDSTSANDSTENTTAPAGTSASSASDNTTGVPATRHSGLMTEHGQTSVADVVVSKIAGVAAREVTGVHGLGGGTARAIGALRERIPGARVNVQQGISVEVG